MSKSRGNKIAEDAPFKRRPYRSVIPRLSCLRLAPSDRLVCLARLSGPFSVSRRSVKRYLRSAIRTRKQKNHPDRKKSCNTLKTNKSSRHKIRKNPHPHHHTPHQAPQSPQGPKHPHPPPKTQQMLTKHPKTRFPKCKANNQNQGRSGRNRPSRSLCGDRDQGACPLPDRRARLTEGRAIPSRVRCSPYRPGA